MRAFTCNWDSYRDETEVKFSENYSQMNWIAKALLLKDAIHDLQNEYEKVLLEKNNG
jgi:hypothetical protein